MFKTNLERAKIPAKEITQIMDGLKLLEKKGVAIKDIKLIVKNIVANPKYRASFIKDPMGTIGGFAPPYVPVAPV